MTQLKEKCPRCTHGIMTLLHARGFGRHIKAPCLTCSPTRTLTELEFEAAAAQRAEELAAAQAKLREHNARMAALGGR